jgi:hypothetical protein
MLRSQPSAFDSFPLLPAERFGFRTLNLRRRSRSFLGTRLAPCRGHVLGGSKSASSRPVNHIAFLIGGFVHKELIGKLKD